MIDFKMPFLRNISCPFSRILCDYLPDKQEHLCDYLPDKQEHRFKELFTHKHKLCHLI